jgi:hypothetical protein
MIKAGIGESKNLTGIFRGYSDIGNTKTSQTCSDKFKMISGVPASKNPGHIRANVN